MRDVTNRLNEPKMSEVENALRQPEIMTGVFPGLVSAGIVGFVRNMQKAFPGGVPLGGHVLGVNEEKDDTKVARWLSCGTKDFPQIPRGSCWYDQTSPFPAPRTFGDATTLGSTKIIETNFDPELDGNRKLPEELRKGGNNANVPFTEMERAKALNATCPKTLNDLETEARAQLDTGLKKPNSYIKVSPELFAESNILIHGVGGQEKGLICFILSSDTLTPEEKQYLLLITRLTVGMDNEVVDTKKVGPEYCFRGFHFGAWGKMSKSGKLAPKDLHPCLYLGESSQAGPYLDRVVRLQASCFNISHFLHCPQAQFNRAIEVILQPALAKLKVQIPGLLELHQKLFDSLNPTMQQLGSAPFCMTVLNVQPMTQVHVNASDQIDSICLILALGDHEGGDLCLYSGGFRIPLPHGTFMAIPSKRDLHFNLHFKGQRFSYVFTSDGALRRWADHRNDMPSLMSGSIKQKERSDTPEDGSDGVNDAFE
ncbi:hypothetical protein FS749_015670 [Ceratobasidium sp. UAMH 11750]|nr:hypothetical protein FS749_015670 [Ceratobasidium sp. UAMH 11750]